MIGSGASLYGSPILPIVRRHAQDAAWYWSQLAADRLSPVVDARRARHYQQLFTCHLQGLRVAGELGWTLACKELERWKDPEQLFVCGWLALQTGDAAKIAALGPFLPEVPRAEAALAAAMLWSKSPCLQRWLHSPVPHEQRCALVACALHGELPDIPLAPLFTADPPSVAAACCLVACLRLEDCLPLVLHAAQSPHPDVREQAGKALLACNRAEEALPLLLEAVLRHEANRLSGEGGSALWEEERAQVLACLCGHALPLGQLARLPGLPAYLRPLVYAHHGDAAALPLLAELLETVHAPTALRAICRLTGLDPDTVSLPPVLPDSPEYAVDPPAHPGHRLESGLPMPDVPRVRAWLADHADALPRGVPLLQGREATLETCLDVLENGWQDERFAAACHAMRLSPCLFVDTTGPQALQTARCQALRRFSAQERT